MPGGDVVVAAEPTGERGCDGNAYGRHGEAEYEARGYGLSQHVACGCVVLGSDLVGGLYRKSRSDGRTDAPEEPEACRHKSYRCRVVGSEPSHHRRVDILHENARQLREHCRERQYHGELQLLAEAHRGTFSYLRYIGHGVSGATNLRINSGKSVSLCVFVSFCIEFWG